MDPVEEPLWVAEDPESDCLGVGKVEAEAVGNLVSVVAEFEERGARKPLLKVPGRVVARPSARTGRGSASSVLDRLRSLF